MPRKIAPTEWLWVSVATLLILFTTSFPYYLGLRSSTEQMHFGGFLFGLDDMWSYVAKMRYGAYDGWLFRLFYTTEVHSGGFVFGFHLALGKLAGLITGQGARVSAETLVVTYHIARIICGSILLLVMYRFGAEYLETPAKRRLAWALAAIAGGLGWIWTVISAATDARTIPTPVEFVIPEAFTLLLPYGLPHLALARSLLLIGWILFFRSLDNGRLSSAVLAGVAWLGMGILVPFYVALLGTLIAVWLGVLWFNRRALPLNELRFAASAGVVPLIILIYNGWLFSTNKVFAQWAAQNILHSPPFLDYLLAYIVLILLGIPAIINLLKAGLNHRTVLLIVWPITALALAYVPINVQRRMLEGVIIPLTILATMGLWSLVGEKPDDRSAMILWRLRQIGGGIVLSFLLPSAVLLIGGGAMAASKSEQPLFQSTDELDVLHWLGQRAQPGSVVMVTPQVGNILPAYAPVRVYTGHGPETIGAPNKEIRARAFFEGTMKSSDAQALLEEIRARYVWVGGPGYQFDCPQNICFDPTLLGLEEIYHSGEFTIFKVKDS